MLVKCFSCNARGIRAYRFENEPYCWRCFLNEVDDSE